MTLEREDIGHHISRQFNDELRALHANVVEMGGLVRQQVQDAVRSIVARDPDLAARVISRDPEVNAMELAIDQECNLLLVRRQPAAGDLRLVFAVIKAVIDLERIGDLAKRVAKSAIETAADSRGFGPQLANLGDAVVALLDKAIAAFARLDVEAALQVRAEDRPIDAECKAVERQLLTLMMEDARTISAAMSVSWAARSLERAGDHAKNIAEYVFYAVHGKDLRHMGAEERAQWLRSRPR
ncbi:MAG: phosphate signaling complex protein PhoU [Gammaproteobacteria bacterium]